MIPYSNGIKLPKYFYRSNISYKKCRVTILIYESIPKCTLTWYI